ncbi:outer membrane protein assembly factor BamD [bacterium]|nr:outer membrane protein assembly factor BamD [bacterium]
MENRLRMGKALAGCIVVVLMIGFWKCSRETVNLIDMAPEQAFEYAKRTYDREDYLQAKNEFTVIVYNHPASLVSEKAQFYLAESHYHLKEYILAISEYEKLIRNFPQSTYSDDALYKVGMCYYQLSPGYALDQEYTLEAVSKFQQFLDEYPDSDLRTEAVNRLDECLRKLMKKEYETGELYRKQGYYRAAIISYDYVLESNYQTEFVERSLYWKGECLYKLGDLEEAEDLFQTVIRQYPQSEWAERAERKLEDIQSN